ncbi:4Fe-4S binding protein [Jiulongibacter sediminis]|jgi:Pyruvate/2-oxoacid:ferredoxin oxidoreductase delta subunit|uniref:4Fe-4S binding protein n=1 Tax=Jiulongibacter sediminis TaxID=1605367 RepID=UPI0026F36E8C|nr:4Fe-4S binding protein [Jiulongibacter sediminis]
MKNTGIFLILTALVLWIALLFGNTFKLTPEILFDTASQEHADLLRPKLEGLFDQEHSNVFSFSSSIKNAITEVNNELDAEGKSHQKIYDTYELSLTKASGNGLVSNNKGLLFGLVFSLLVLGALMFILPDLNLLPGIKNDGIFHHPGTSVKWLGIILGALLIIFYILLYFFPHFISNWIIVLDPLSNFMNGNKASQWFLYGFLYTIAVLVMGIRMLVKYLHSKYQMIRTGSVMFFQLIFAFMIPEILTKLNMPSADLKNMWPLDYSFFFDYRIDQKIEAGTLGIFMFVWGIILFAVGVPVLTYFYGKRWYCSWVCGCGGLAETLGDPFRQLSNKSLKAWKIERWLIHAVLVFAVIMTIGVIYTYMSGNSAIFGVIDTGTLRYYYGFAIGSIFSGVVGTGFYPLMGNRVWCRFGCPLAAYLGIVQRFKSRFRITTNGGQCISCGNCSTYCEQGIDVRWYAQRGQDIVRSSCVGCGVCSAVCPRGVLNLENGPESSRNI